MSSDERESGASARLSPGLRLRLARPCTVLTSPDQVRLIASEDERFALDGVGIDAWLPGFLAGMNGDPTVDELVAALPAGQREAARALVGDLLGERILVAADATDIARSLRVHAVLEGAPDLCRALADVVDPPSPATQPLVVFCQDTLDLDAARVRGRLARSRREPWLWVTIAPVTRAYVGPVFLPDAGPCVSCLLTAFARRSPAPELYDDLTAHGRAGGAFAQTPAAPWLQAALTATIRWKVDRLGEIAVPPEVFALHVIEHATGETRAHELAVDPECPDCGDGA